MKGNRISRQLDEYLDYKHSLGFKLTHEESVLRNFANYTLDIGYSGSLNVEIVLSWIASGSKKNKTMARKMQVIKPFSKYVSALDSEAQCIQGKFYRNTHDRPEPYIYSENEVLMLMNECDRLYSPDGIRARTVKCIIGLLWATGMRPSEPVNLIRKDVDLAHACITVRETKFAKERIISVSASVIQALEEYINWLDPLVGGMAPDDPLFRTTGGVPLCERALSYAFSCIRDSIGAAPNGYSHIRLYDFRHTLACSTILRWLNEGNDASAMIYNLSAFLGHVKVEDTYWYLTATPELMNITCSMYEKRFGGGYDA